MHNMRKHADIIIRPKFELVLNILERELGGLGIGEWTNPKGGYFISFDSMEGCVKNIVTKAKEAGVVMTGKQELLIHTERIQKTQYPHRTYIPVYGRAGKATKVFVVCVKLASVEKLLAE